MLYSCTTYMQESTAITLSYSYVSDYLSIGMVEIVQQSDFSEGAFRMCDSLKRLKHLLDCHCFASDLGESIFSLFCMLQILPTVSVARLEKEIREDDINVKYWEAKPTRRHQTLHVQCMLYPDIAQVRWKVSARFQWCTIDFDCGLA